MYHYVYCIENVINGKVYVGKHSTIDLNDGYMGSGKLVTQAIAKYGLENFRKHILKECESSEEAFEFEKFIVDEEFVSDENTYNLTIGGRGGDSGTFVHCNEFLKANPEIRRKNSSAGGIALWSKPGVRERHRQEMSAKNRRLHALGLSKFKCDRTGSHHSDETKRKIGEANAISQRGERNSQFGTLWIHNVVLMTSKKIKLCELETYLELGWLKGRKIKW